MNWRLLITRPAQECAGQGAALSAAGVFSWALPLFKTEPLPATPLAMSSATYDAFIVVSKTAARCALDYFADDLISRQKPWFAVGAGTGQLLQQAGLRCFWPSLGDDSEALLALPELAQALAQPTPRVLIVRGETGREHLSSSLRGQGVSVDYLPLYRRVALDYPPGHLARCIQDNGLNALQANSGESLARLIELAQDDWPKLARLPLLVPGARVASLAKAAGAQQVIDCQGASTAALLATLKQLIPQ